MSWYTVALFAHIVGVVTLFSAMALQWLITLRLRRAESIAQAREWSNLTKGLNRLAPVSGALILGAGVYMTILDWNMLTTWIDVSIAAMGVMMLFGMGIVGQRLKAIQRAVAQEPSDVIPEALRARMDDPILWISMQIAVTVALSIVFVMTNKPGLTISIASLIVSVALGASIGMLTLRPQQVRGAPSPATAPVTDTSVK